MTASVAEQILGRMEQTLVAAVPAVGGRVFRGRLDALGEIELPAILMLRGATQHEDLGGGSARVQLAVDVHCVAAGSSWETATDEIAVAVDEALQADTVLAGLARGLRLTGTTAEGASGGGGPIGRLTLSYQAHFAHRRGQPGAAQT